MLEERRRMTVRARLVLLAALVWAGYIGSFLVRALALKDPGGLAKFVGSGEPVSWGWLLEATVTVLFALGAVWGRGWRMHLAFWWTAFLWSAFWATGIFAVRYGEWLALIPCAVRSLLAALFLPLWAVRTAVVAVREQAWPLLGVAAFFAAVGLAPFVGARDVVRCLIPGMELPEPRPEARPVPQKAAAASRGEGRQGEARAADEEQQRPSPVRDPHAFDGLVGVEEAVAVLREAFELAALYPQIAQKYRLQPPRGLLLEGPPGTGKTSLARAAARYFGCAFASVSLPDLLSRWVGDSEQRLHQYFEWARRNAPAILFFDEIDAIGMKRDGSHMNRAPDILLRVLLEEMDGFRGREGVFVLAATNRADTLDPALLRPGRFDRRVRLGLPGPEARRKLFEIYLTDRPCSPSVDLEELVRRTEGMSPAEIKQLCDRAAARAARREAETGREGAIVREDFGI
jgi:AAA+ superfamily predicted ATPase